MVHQAYQTSHLNLCSSEPRAPDFYNNNDIMQVNPKNWARQMVSYDSNLLDQHSTIAILKLFEPITCHFS